MSTPRLPAEILVMIATKSLESWRAMIYVIAACGLSENEKKRIKTSFVCATTTIKQSCGYVNCSTIVAKRKTATNYYVCVGGYPSFTELECYKSFFAKNSHPVLILPPHLLQRNALLVCATANKVPKHKYDGFECCSPESIAVFESVFVDAVSNAIDLMRLNEKLLSLPVVRYIAKWREGKRSREANEWQISKFGSTFIFAEISRHRKRIEIEINPRCKNEKFIAEVSFTRYKSRNSIYVPISAADYDLFTCVDWH